MLQPVSADVHCASAARIDPDWRLFKAGKTRRWSGFWRGETEAPYLLSPRECGDDAGMRWRMRGLNISLPGALAACLCAIDAGATTFRAPIALMFDLQPAESILFQQIACTDRYGVLLDQAEASDEIGTGKLEDSKDVFVRCRSHRRIEGQPVKYLVECRRADLAAAWECDPGRETMMARVGGILVSVTIDEGSSANLDQAFVVVKYLRSSGQLKDQLVEESPGPGEEGSVSCRVFPRYPDQVETVRCFGVDDVPVARALELQP